MAFNNKITVEIPLFFTFINFLICGSIFTNLVVYRTCYIILGYDKTQCAELGNENNNDTQKLEKLVEPTANIIIMVKTLLDSIFPVFVCMIAGPWSDKFGRKPVILMALIGMACGGALMIPFSYMENLSPWYFLISSIPGMLTGGGTTYFAVTLSYLSDISTEETRGMRMAIYEVALASGVLTGSLSSSYIFYATNYQTIFEIGTGCMLISILYMAFLVPESLQNRSQISPSTNLEERTGRVVQLQYFKDMLYTTIKNRENYDRALILLTVAAIIVFTFVTGGDSSIQFIFLRGKLDWTLTKYTVFNSAYNVLWVIGTMAGTFLFQKKLKIRESVLALVGLVSMLCCIILQLLATSDVFIYSAGVAKCLGGLVAPMLRSQVSRLVPPDEVGKIFSIIVGGGALLSLGASPLYTLVYNATINIDAALFNFLSIGLFGITIILVIIIMTLESKYSSYPLKDEEAHSETSKVH